MSKFNGSMKTTQPIIIYLSFTEGICLSTKQAENINHEIERIIDENIKEGNVVNACRIERGDGFNEDPIMDIEDFDICVTVPVELACHITYDPGLYAYANGDPGYPPSLEIDDCEGEILELDEGTIRKELLNLETIGEKIKEINIVIDEPDMDGDLDY